ncbi:MerR-like DNA binding protein [Georgenia soli]|uniref:MerR-like DNA binding protein n=2 Tax=Georgenia soli TaxID=638953 RepID=A0A2A9EN32_9MICO|nr:MerR-like DNA binding protein [Georgenia soli]
MERSAGPSAPEDAADIGERERSGTRGGRPDGAGRAPKRSRAHAPGGAPLTVAAVAGRLGVAASTLRTWDRRYGLGPSAHEAGAHRRYSPDDVARLERMRQLTLQGVAPADAARAAAAYDPADPTAAPPPEESAGGRHRPEPHERVLVDPLSLAAAAVEPDPPRVQRMFDQEVGEKGIVRAWTTLAKPALSMLGQRDRSDRPGADPEAVLVGAVLAAVRDVVANEPSPDGSTGTALLCASEERRVRAHVIGGGLAERGVRARVLRAEQVRGGDQVLRAVEERHARVLAVLGSPDGAEELVRTVSERGDVDVFLLGSDAPELWLPNVHRVRTPMAAVEEIAAVMHG